MAKEATEAKSPKAYMAFYRVVLVKEKGGYYHFEKVIKSPQYAYEAAIELAKIDEEAQEVMGLICLNTKNRMTAIHEISRGTLNSSLIHPREVFKVAILHNAAGIILFHNHPSGDPTPSNEDIQVTERIAEAGELMGIELLDHVVIGDGRFASMKERGLM